MLRPKLMTVLLTVAAASPVAGIALWSIHRSVVEIADPCAKWKRPPDRQMTIAIGPHDGCRAVTVHSDSKVHATIIAALVPGGLLTAAVLGVVGAAWSRRRMMLAAATCILAETLVVFTIAPLTLVAGVSFLLLSRRLRPSHEGIAS